MTVMGDVLTRLCDLLAGSARIGRPLSLGGKYEMRRVDSLPPWAFEGGRQVDSCSRLFCDPLSGGQDDRLSLYLLEGGWSTTTTTRGLIKLR